MDIESYRDTETKLKRISWLSGKDQEMVFHNVMHHINEESLRLCFNELDARKAVGIDGIDKQEYGKNLENNLKDLIGRMRRMTYRQYDKY